MGNSVEQAVSAVKLLLSIVGAVIGIGLLWLVLLGQQSEDSQSLRLGTNVWPGYEPLYLARHLNFYDESSVRLVECSSASQVIRKFRNNTLEVAALTLDEVLLLKDDGFDVKIILVTDISHGGDVILAKPGFANLKGLSGCDIGVENTALGAYVLTRAMQAAGMTSQDVNVVPLEIDEHERAYDNGDVDAIVTFEPVRSRLISKGAVKIFDSTQIPGEIVDVLVARKTTIETNANNLSELLRGWFSAVEYFQEHPDDAAEVMAERLKLKPNDALSSFDGLKLPGIDENVTLIGGVNPGLAKTAERLSKLMLKQNLLKSEVDISQLFAAEPLKTMQDK